MKARSLFYAVLLAILSVLSGCGQAVNDTETPSAAADPVSKEPVELTFKPSYTMTDAQIESFIKEPLSKKYPNMTIRVVNLAKGETWEDWVLAGQVPDFWGAPYKDPEIFTRLKIVEDLNPMIKKSGVDVNRFESSAVNTIKGYSEHGELYGLPYWMNFAALFYNKDIFDKFAVPYPKDGMTWDEAIALARKLTRTDSGLTYIGIDPSTPAGFNLALGNSFGPGDRAKLTTEGWQKIFTTLKQVYDIPGFVQGKKFSYGLDSFTKDRILAMQSYWGNNVIFALDELYNKGTTMNWDMVTQPTYAENRGHGWDAAAQAFFISNKSKHKNEAFEVIKLVTSDEVQQKINRQGILPGIVKTNSMKQDFGKDLPILKGKNTAAIFKMTPSPAVTHKYYSIISSELSKAAQAVALKQKDVNTALRDAEEKANQLIADQEGKAK